MEWINILENDGVKRLDAILARTQTDIIETCKLLELNEKAVMDKAAEYHRSYHERMRLITHLLEESQPPERRRQALVKIGDIAEIRATCAG